MSADCAELRVDWMWETVKRESESYRGQETWKIIECFSEVGLYTSLNKWGEHPRTILSKHNQMTKGMNVQVKTEQEADAGPSPRVDHHCSQPLRPRARLSAVRSRAGRNPASLDHARLPSPACAMPLGILAAAHILLCALLSMTLAFAQSVPDVPSSWNVRAVPQR
jgi:hypothetical protein